MADEEPTYQRMLERIHGDMGRLLARRRRVVAGEEPGVSYNALSEGLEKQAEGMATLARSARWVTQP